MTQRNGTIFDDTLEGSETDTILSGLGGDDTLIGGFDGNSTLYGGDGSDYMYTFVEAARTWMYGGEGSDDFGGGFGVELAYGGDGNDYFSLTGGADSIYGGAGTDVLALYGGNNEGVNFTLAAGGTGSINGASFGLSGITRFTGIEGLAGSGADDTLRGNGSDNSLYGNFGADILLGLGGNDALMGAEGHDTLTGGLGRDAFLFFGAENRRELASQADVITDFNATQDRLVFFSRNFAGLHTGAEEADATVADIDLFNILASEFAVQTTRQATKVGVRVIYDSDDGLLYYDADGALSGHRSRLIADIGEGHNLQANDIFIY